MENVFIYILLLIAMINVSVHVDKSNSAMYALSCIDYTPFALSIDYDHPEIVDNVIYPAFEIEKLEENFVTVLKNNLGSYKGQMDLEFFYYNVQEQKDCLHYSLVCNGVEVKVTLKDFMLNHERIYSYEIVPI
jgi:hypothetical protein